LSEGGRPEKRTTKPPPVTQEDAGAGDLDSEEEEFDDDDDGDDGLERRSVANDRIEGGRPKEDDDEALEAARDESTLAFIPARLAGPRTIGPTAAAAPRIPSPRRLVISMTSTRSSTTGTSGISTTTTRSSTMGTSRTPPTKWP
jgi:hypothetical protein